MYWESVFGNTENRGLPGKSMGNRYRVNCTGSVSGSTENRGLVENGKWISCEKLETLEYLEAPGSACQNKGHA